MKSFDCISADDANTRMEILAYYNSSVLFKVTDVNEHGYLVHLPVPLLNGINRIRLCWDFIKDDFFTVSPMVNFSQGSNNADTDVLKPQAIVRTTEATRFLYEPDRTWSVNFEKGTRFVVRGRDDHTHEIILEPEAGGRTIQLHLTNARFFEEEPEQPPEDIPTNDGVVKDKATLPSEVKELQALIEDQEKLLAHQDENYRKLRILHEAGLKRRLAQATRAGEPLPSCIIDELLDMAICPFLTSTPGPSDTRVLQNGQLVSQSAWDTYLRKLPQDSTPRCPLTRIEITQNPITCPALKNIIEALQKMQDVRNEKSAVVDVDTAPSDAKKRKL